MYHLISANLVKKRNDSFGIRMCATFNSPCSLCNEKETLRGEKFRACFACLGSSPQEFTLELRNCIAIALANERTYGQTQVTQRADEKEDRFTDKGKPASVNEYSPNSKPIKIESDG